MHYVILTGASKGIGLATAKELLSTKVKLFAISRSKNEDLIEFAKDEQGEISYIEFDLARIREIFSLMKKIFNEIDSQNTESLSLINNAGMLEPIRPIDNSSPVELSKNIDVNLTAPLGLVSQFIKQAKNFKVEKRIINISSGAAQHPYPGWSGYCISKAGIDMLTQVVAHEQADRAYPTKIMSLAPGIVATNMQKQIRQKDKSEFPRVEKFIQLKENNQLRSPETVGKKITEILFQDNFENGSRIDLRNL